MSTVVLDIISQYLAFVEQIPQKNRAGVRGSSAANYDEFLNICHFFPKIQRMAEAKKFLAFLVIPLICACYCTAQEYSIEQARAIRKNVVACAKQYIGCPYQSGAVGPDAFDCSGLVYAVMREAANLQMPRSAKAIYSKAKTIKLSQAEEGDLVFFKTTGDGSISHVGIFIGKNQFIHAASSGANTGVIVSSLKERYYANSFAGAGRVLPLGRGSNSEEENLQDDFFSSENSVAATTDSANGNSGGTDSASQNSSAENRSKNASADVHSNSEKWYAKLEFDVALFYDWNFFLPNRAALNWRGIALETDVRYAGWKFQPGLGTIFRYNHGTRNFQIPIVFSLSFNEYIKVYVGPVINFGSPKIPDSDEKIKGNFFPGIFGASFQTPSLKIGKVKLSLVQDVEITIFKRTNGRALSFSKGVGTGMVFSTGIRVTLPMSNFLK